jgi:MOSC domain-containing protein YiiM
VLQVTTYTSPCVNIAPLFEDRDFSRVSQKRHPGWSRVYARVLAGGDVRPGDCIRIVGEREVSEVLQPAP